MQQLQLKDFLNYRFLSEVRYAPDGQKAAFVVSSCEEEQNAYSSRLYLYDGQVRQMTDLGKERGFVWLDENRILFPAVRSEKEKKRAAAHEQFTSYCAVLLHVFQVNLHCMSSLYLTLSGLWQRW